MSVAFGAEARGQSVLDDQWRYVLEPYVMLPNMHGTVGLDNLPDASVNESPGDIFNHLQFGAMLYLEAHDDLWAITSDLMYSNVAESASSTPLIAYGRVDLKLLLWELAGLYRLSPWLEAGAGFQLTNIQSDLNLAINTPLAPISKSFNSTQTWTDPTIIARGTFPLTAQWTLVARGNVGGFGVSSKFAWQAQLYAVYGISETMAVSFGYRAFGDDYESGSGRSRFLYNVTTFGPVIRFAFKL